MLSLDLGDIVKVLPTAASLVGGFVVKTVSKRKGSDAHKVLSPLAALVMGLVAAAFGQSPDIINAGASGAAYAVLGHTLWKNATQLIQKPKAVNPCS